MRALVMAAALVTAMPLSAQSQPQRLAELVSDVCGNPREGGKLDNVESIRRRGGEAADEPLPLCLIYSKGWLRAYEASNPTDTGGLPGLCKALTIKTIQTGRDEFAAFFGSYMAYTEIERVNAIRYCESYKQGFTAGLQEAKAMVR